MGPRRRVSRDLVLLERKIKYAKRFQKEFEKHIERPEQLLTLAKGGNRARVLSHGGLHRIRAYDAERTGKGHAGFGQEYHEALRNRRRQ